MLADKSPAYMTARACIKELMDLYVLCDRSGLPLPPSIDGPTAAGQKVGRLLFVLYLRKAFQLDAMDRMGKGQSAKIARHRRHPQPGSTASHLCLSCGLDAA